MRLRLHSATSNRIHYGQFCPPVESLRSHSATSKTPREDFERRHLVTEAEQSLVPVEAIAGLILVLRGQKVILDADLAHLYGVTTRRLNEQAKRNRERFPDDFVFQLNDEETQNLMSHFATSSSSRHGGRRKNPWAFTEHGALMAAMILNSPTAVEASVYVVRAFIRLRELLYTHAELSHKLAELESRVDHHDDDIAMLLEAIHQLLTPPEPPPQRKIGYRVREPGRRYVVSRKN